MQNTILTLVTILAIAVPAFATTKKPLPFAVTGNELQLQTPQINFKLDKKSKNNSLTLGNIVFDNESLTATSENSMLTIAWNPQLIASGTFAMTNAAGQSLITGQASQTPFTYNDFTLEKIPQLKNKSKIRFTLRSDIGSGYSMLQSQWYEVDITNNVISLKPLTKKSTNARITLQNKPQPSTGSAQIDYESSANFLATLNTDATYIFVSEPVAPTVEDMIVAPTGDKFTLVVSGTPIEVSSAKTEFYLSGKSGGVFTYPFIVKDPPTENDRHYTTEKTVLETYLPKDKMSIIDGQGNSKHVEFDLPQKNAYNKVSIDIPGKELTHKSYLEIYRGSQREANLRLTGLKGDETVFIAEGAFTWWFNDIGNSQNYHLSKLRWGTTVKFFNSINKLPASTNSGGEDVALKSLQLDLRYRLTPGVWSKTPTWGLIGSYENITIGEVTAPNLGLGVFWTNPMPGLVDKHLNRLSFLNHPKWINIEFINYLASMDSDIDLGSNYSLNVQGKMLFRERYVGEAGFGAKKYYYTEKSTLEGASLTMLFATLGLGITF